jgi:hypothetical protein
MVSKTYAVSLRIILLSLVVSCGVIKDEPPILPEEHELIASVQFSGTLDDAKELLSRFFTIQGYRMDELYSYGNTISTKYQVVKEPFSIRGASPSEVEAMYGEWLEFHIGSSIVDPITHEIRDKSNAELRDEFDKEGCEKLKICAKAGDGRILFFLYTYDAYDGADIPLNSRLRYKDLITSFQQYLNQVGR